MEAMRLAEPPGLRHDPAFHDLPTSAGLTDGPFDLADTAAWATWRAAKLAARPTRLADLIVDVADLATPTAAERVALAAVLARANMAIYRTPVRDEDTSRRAVAAFARAVGLTRFEHHRSAGADGIVAIRVTDAPRQAGFIPYSPRPLGWHTDGYYAWDGPHAAIQSMVLHCVRAAPEGGANALLDPEIAYVRLRDRDPALVAALMRPDAMTIPPCVEEDGTVRGETVGPVFFVDPATGRLGMRYTARKRHVVWRDDPATRAAAAALIEIMADDPAIFRL
ncbi:MAG: TauD/TfdA family dioxygenase, partial [Phyllobacteriaceae bacterium]|nr:TauD/TfdA family dioxygenase [Phyllobacteriaceae bacterium]